MHPLLIHLSSKATSAEHRICRAREIAPGIGWRWSSLHVSHSQRVLSLYQFRKSALCRHADVSDMQESFTGVVMPSSTGARRTGTAKFREVVIRCSTGQPGNIDPISPGL